MVYVALLRGVNVGGKAMVSMGTLKEQFEGLGFGQVKTYINSGNIIFTTPETDRTTLTQQIEKAIRTPELDIKVLLKNLAEIKGLLAAIPDDWENNSETKCDVLFLWPESDNAEMLEQIPNNDEVETVRYEPGAILHNVTRANATKSRMTRIIGTPLYKNITIRNINTVRKLLTIMEDIA
jgi:uncharacterized protein (DUF1697 family)